MSAASDMLVEFHAAVSHPDTDVLWTRRTLHDEEHAELVEALDELDPRQTVVSCSPREGLEHVARELADVVYVAPPDFIPPDMSGVIA